MYKLLSMPRANCRFSLRARCIGPLYYGRSLWLRPLPAALIALPERHKNERTVTRISIVSIDVFAPAGRMEAASLGVRRGCSGSRELASVSSSIVLAAIRRNWQKRQIGKSIDERQP